MTKKIALVACKRVRQQNICFGDARCLVALMRREEEFERYKGEDASIVGIVECGECHGERAPLQLASLRGVLASLGETADIIHTGTCISAFCRHKDELMNYIKNKVDIEVVDGGHRYAPPKIFP
ncbi:MAG TPA: CGGC domain-containing protein [Archaeoglobaceae archaeon]|nr:CGGC domain-containing protein [Archaeoglobaceae archaeon]